MADIPPYGKPRIYRLYIRCRSGQQLRNEEEAAGCSHPDSLPGAGLRGNTTGLHLAEAVCLPEKVVLPVKMQPPWAAASVQMVFSFFNISGPPSEYKINGKYKNGYIYNLIIHEKQQFVRGKEEKEILDNCLKETKLYILLKK